MAREASARRPALVFILATVAINMLGVGLAWPILPKLVQQFEGGNVSSAAFTYGILATVFALAQFIFQPVAGALSDRFGRKPVILIALGGLGLDYLLMALAPDLWWLMIARIMGGVFGATTSTAYAYVADISSPEDRSRNFGYIGAAFGAGFIAGPLLGGILGEIDLRLPFFAAAALAGINLILGLLVLPESLDASNRKAFSLTSANPFGALTRISQLAGLSSLMLALLLVNIGQRGLEAIWVLYAGFRFDWGVRDAAFSLAFVGAMFVLVQGLLVGPAVRRFGEWRVVAGGFLLSAFSLFCYAFVSEGWMVYPLMVLHILGDALAVPALTAICSKAAPANEQGLLQGTIGSVNSVAIVIGPLAASMVLAFVTSPGAPVAIPGAWFLIAALLFLSGFALVARRSREHGGG